MSTPIQTEKQMKLEKIERIGFWLMVATAISSVVTIVLWIRVALAWRELVDAL